VIARRLLAGVAAIGATALLAGPAIASPSSDTPASLALHSCRLHGLSHDAMCGTLRRPLEGSDRHRW